MMSNLKRADANSSPSSGTKCRKVEAERGSARSTQAMNMEYTYYHGSLTEIKETEEQDAKGLGNIGPERKFQCAVSESKLECCFAWNGVSGQSCGFKATRSGTSATVFKPVSGAADSLDDKFDIPASWFEFETQWETLPDAIKIDEASYYLQIYRRVAPPNPEPSSQAHQACAQNFQGKLDRDKKFTQETSNGLERFKDANQDIPAQSEAAKRICKGVAEEFEKRKLDESATKAQPEIAVAGPVGSGKSTLINALLEQPVASALALGGAAVTQLPTEYRHTDPLEILNGVQGTASSSDETLDLVGANTDLTKCLEQLTGVPVPRFCVTLTYLTAAEWTHRLHDVLLDDICQESERTHTGPKPKNASKKESKKLKDVTQRAAWKKLRHVYGRKFMERYAADFNSPHIDVRETAARNFKEEAAELHESVHDVCLSKVFAGEETGYKLLGRSFTGRVFILEDLDGGKAAAHRQTILKKETIAGNFPALQICAEASLMIVDLPGFGDADRIRDEVAQSYLQRATRVLVCANAGRAGSDKRVRDFLGSSQMQDFHRAKATVDCLAFVATAADSTTLDEMSAQKHGKGRHLALTPDGKMEAYRQRVKKGMREVVRELHYSDSLPIFVTTARQYQIKLGIRQATKGLRQEMYGLEQTGLPSLVKFLWDGVVRDWQKKRSQRSNAVCQIYETSLAHVNAVQRAARAGEPFKARTKDKAKDVAKEVEASGTAFKDRLSTEVPAIANAKTSQDTFEALLATVPGQSRGRTDVAVEKWGNKHHNTLRSLLRRERSNTTAGDLAYETLFRPTDNEWNGHHNNIQLLTQPNCRARVRQISAEHANQQMEVARKKIEDDETIDKIDKERLFQELEARHSEPENALPALIDSAAEALEQELRQARKTIQEKPVVTALQARFSEPYLEIREAHSGKGSHMARVLHLKAHTKDNWDLQTDMAQHQGAFSRIKDAVKKFIDSVAGAATYGVASLLLDAGSCNRDQLQADIAGAKELDVQALKELQKLAREDADASREALEEMERTVLAEAAAESGSEQDDSEDESESD